MSQDYKLRLPQEASFQNPSEVFFHRPPQLNRKIKAFNGVNFAQGTKVAEEKYILFSADPRGIGFAFHPD
jgi:hypothetical protein